MGPTISSHLKKLNSLFLLIGIIFLFQVNPAQATEDINCTCQNQRFDRPGACLNNCHRRLGCTGCFLSPQCEPLKNDKQLIQFYNQAMFGIGPVPRPQSWRVLIAHIVNKFYKPYNAGQMNITIGPPEGDNWASIGNQPVDGKYTLTVSEDLFWLSPSMVVSVIGHEMIHLSQYKRKINIDFTGINSAVSAFQELEASTWETGNTDFNWEIGQNKVYSCLLEGTTNQNEKATIQQTLQCRQWQVKKAIEDIRNSPRSQYLANLEKWLNENPWTKAIWLPRNPNWKTYNAGTRPEGCENL